MTIHNRISDGLPATASNQAPWSDAAHAIIAKVRTRIPLLITAALLGALTMGTLRLIFPPSYFAIAQVLIDPRGIRISSRDLSGGNFDANAAINFVESQMVVVMSNSVLLRVVRDEKLGLLKSRQKRAALPEPGSPDRVEAETMALNLLQRLVAVYRGDRSFIVNIKVTHDTPQSAADIANSIVQSFIIEDAENRTDRTTQLRSDFNSRLGDLRHGLQEAEMAVETFRVKSGLVGAHDKTVIEQQLKEGIVALSAAQVSETRARMRLAQLETDPEKLASAGKLDVDGATRNIVQMLERMTKARSELVELSGALGEKHPSLAAARTKVEEYQRDLVSALTELRGSARSDIERAKNETAALMQNVEQLSQNMTTTRVAEVELRALEREAEGRRKIFEAFQTRSREASEFGSIDASNLRIVSPARPPANKSTLPGFIIWSGFGSVLGLLLTVSGLAFTTVRDFLPLPFRATNVIGS